MVELPAAGECVSQRWLIAQIAFDPFDGQPLEVLEIGSSASHDADLDAAVDQRACDCAADESGCTSDEDLHFEDVKGER
jgi:hypothetical protein